MGTVGSSGSTDGKGSLRKFGVLVVLGLDRHVRVLIERQVSMTYRLFTEDINREVIASIVASRFDGFTVIPSFGYWKGKPENSVIVEIETENREAVMSVANEIKTANKQEAVLVEEVETKGELV